MPSVTPSLVTHAFARVRPVGALWRLRGYLKPYRTQMIVMFAAAFGAVAAEIVIPLLTKSIIDGAITHHDQEPADPARPWRRSRLGAARGGAELSCGAGSRPARSPAWRRPCATTCTRTCSGCSPAFHDEWQSGQLLSRATTDLSAIRRFAGFGLIFLVTNLVTFVAWSRC